MGLEDNPPCQAEACSLQTCLNKHTYSPDKCDDLLKQLYLCCSSMYERDPKASSSACASPEATREKLKMLKAQRYAPPYTSLSIALPSEYEQPAPPAQELLCRAKMRVEGRKVGRNTCQLLREYLVPASIPLVVADHFPYALSS